MSEGWIKLHRALLDNPIWTCSTPEQKVILITLLSMVNHKPNKWMWKGQKFEVQAGQVITSLDSLTRKSGKGISIRNVRTALKNFENLEFLTNEPTKQGRLLTVVNWGKYQESANQSDKPTDKALTNDRQTGDKEVTTNKNDKNLKNEDNDKKKGKSLTDPPKIEQEKDFEFTQATLNIISEKGYSEKQARDLLSQCFAYYRANGKRMKCWQSCYQNWIRKEYNQPKPQQQTENPFAGLANG
jgi:hypothetical protein